jgi:RNA ligase
MKFPEINHLQDFDKVLQKDEMRLKEETYGNRRFGIISYMVAFEETFNSELARECRGITFDMETGEVVSRPFHKFFNVNENKYSKFDDIYWDNITVFDKLDGSMLTPVLIDNDTYAWKTKKSFYSDVALHASECWDELIEKGVWTHDFILKYLRGGYTPIFEFMSPMNRVVIDYGEIPQFKLLAVRCNKSGQYFDQSGCKSPFAEGKLKYTPETFMKNLLESDKWEGTEGFVISDGVDMYKLKTKWYVERHKLVGDLNAKRVVEFTVNEEIDDVIATFTNLRMTSRIEYIKGIRDKTNTIILVERRKIKQYWDSLKRLGNDRKKFALSVQKNVPAEYKGFMFSMLDGNDDKFEMGLKRHCINLGKELLGEENI